MAVQVTPVERRQDGISQLMPIAGSLIGGAYGGSAGAAVGGQVGGAISNPGNDAAQVPQAQHKNPVDRALAKQEQLSTLREGLAAARESDNPETKQYTPYLEEAMKKARGQQSGGSIA